MALNNKKQSSDNWKLLIQRGWQEERTHAVPFVHIPGEAREGRRVAPAPARARGSPARRAPAFGQDDEAPNFHPRRANGRRSE